MELDGEKKSFFWRKKKSEEKSVGMCIRRDEARFVVRIHPRTTEASGIFTTTGRIIFYNTWKENFGKLPIHCSEFHEWLIHLNKKHGAFYCPYTLEPDPQNFSNFLKLWILYRPWVVCEGGDRKKNEKNKNCFFMKKKRWFKEQQRSFLGKQDISTHDEQKELETLNDTESDEVAAAKKALTLEIKAQDDNSNWSTSNPKVE
jgi:hypothetical protein